MTRYFANPQRDSTAAKGSALPGPDPIASLKALRLRLFLPKPWVILYVFAGLAPTLSQAVTARCPSPNSFTGLEDPDHYVLLPSIDVQTRMPAPCSRCDDPENAAHSGCLVHRLLTSDACGSGRCQDDEGIFVLNASPSRRVALQRDLRYLSPAEHPLARGENCRFLLWALEPSIGIEDRNSRTDFPYWNEAWRASQSLVHPAFPKNQVGFIIQSALTRSQHQLHLHIGRLFEDYQTAILHLKQTPGRTQMVHIRGSLFYARYLLDARGKGPFTGENPFDAVSRMIPEGEAGLAEYGILAARAPDRKGVFVLAARGLERNQLNYRSDKTCRLIERLP